MPNTRKKGKRQKGLWITDEETKRWDEVVKEGGHADRAAWLRAKLEEELAARQGALVLGETVDEELLFTEKTFELLDGLHQTPRASYYVDHKDDFRRALEEPMGKLFKEVAANLSGEALEHMETEKKLLSRVTKNDYGAGGAYDYYWGAFYAKGFKRVEAAQLFVWINHERMEAGFYIGDYGRDQRVRFIKNCRQHRSRLIAALDEEFKGLGLRFGYRTVEEMPNGFRPPSSLGEWIDRLDSIEPSARIFWTKDEVLKSGLHATAAKVGVLFNKLFTLVLLALVDEPIAAIEGYLQNSSRTTIKPGVDEVFLDNATYTIDEMAVETGVKADTLRSWALALERKGQVIFYGPPGTGKTFMAKRLAKHFIGGGNGFTEVVQFHPAYAYEDFIEGLRPVKVDGGIDYKYVPGRLKDFCKRAEKRVGKCVLIVDEINRANLARVFGELMYLLEYRWHDLNGIPLAGGELFQIPKNVRLIGTMNTADRSIALVDHALRRRFAFIPLMPDYDILRSYHEREMSGFAVEGLIQQLKALNVAINDPHYSVGISYFMRKDLDATLQDIWVMEVEPYLEELFFDQQEKFCQFRWDKVSQHISK